MNSETVVLKYCKYCNTEKDLSEFYKHPIASFGVSNRCKTCHNNYGKLRHARRNDPKEDLFKNGIGWVEIPGTNGNFFANRSGQFYRKDKNKLLKGCSAGSNGYHEHSIIKGGKPKTVLTHRILAELFIPNPDNKPEVNHINSDRTDYRLENLEWVTRSENIIHSVRAGRNKIGELKAKSYRDINTGIVYASAKQAADAKGINYGTLRSQLQGVVSNRSGLILCP